MCFLCSGCVETRSFAFFAGVGHLKSSKVAKNLSHPCPVAYAIVPQWMFFYVSKKSKKQMLSTNHHIQMARIIWHQNQAITFDVEYVVLFKTITSKWNTWSDDENATYQLSAALQPRARRRGGMSLMKYLSRVKARETGMASLFEWTSSRQL